LRAPFPTADISLIAAHIELSFGIERVRAQKPSFAAATPETVALIVDEAAKFADRHLAPLNDAADAAGCRLEDGRVKTVQGHQAVWDAYVAAGWPTLDQSEAQGGQGLPLIVAAAVQEIFDRACPAFGMLAVSQRAASKLITAYGDDAMRAEWLPQLASGKWGATICISEVDAGSDAGRMRTVAMPLGDGRWSVTGEKCWISFGDHDLTPRIGHCVLARTPDAAPGGAGISLFLVPGGAEQGDAVSVRRIEHKMGLHGSPTCALGFEGAAGVMLGTEGRGLSQMFVMITQMRISTGVMGLGIASASADLALHYAGERIQGSGLVIAEHADVQRQLLEMVSRVEVLRGLVFAVANLAEAGGDDPEAQLLLQWLLPIVKTVGAETAFDVASGAVQVLGGAGYTREWPAEQAVRDARVLAVFEGTTGIQALDLVHRRLLRGAGLEAFLGVARIEGDDAGLHACLDLLADAGAKLRAMTDQRDIDAGATAFLSLAGLAATGWIAARLMKAEGEAPAAQKVQVAGRYWLNRIAAWAVPFHSEAIAGASPLAGFEVIRA
jgi:alkylation response protein AidB-like acyl-CoA dehydrogenase